MIDYGQKIFLHFIFGCRGSSRGAQAVMAALQYPKGHLALTIHCQCRFALQTRGSQEPT